MLKKLTATAAAAALALTSFTATPAQALDDEGLAILLGVGVLAAIASANKNKDDRADRGRHWDDRDRWDNRRPGNKHPGFQVGRTVPAQCEARVRTRHGTRTYFGEPCLNRAGSRVQLPRSCRERVDVGRREVMAYEKRCLLQKGYRVRG